MKTAFFDIENWREIGATLARNKTRTFLTAFGIFWGTAMLAMLWGGSQGLKGLLYRNFAGFVTNTSIVMPGERSVNYMGYNKGSSWSMTTDDVDIITHNAPAIDLWSTMSFAGATASYGNKSTSANLLGVDPDYFSIQTPALYEGRIFNEGDNNAARKVVMIGRNIANTLYPNESPVGKSVSLNGIFFTIVGVVGQTNQLNLGGRVDDNFLMPASTMRENFTYGNTVYCLLFTAPDGHKPSENNAAISRVISRRHYIDPTDAQAIYFMDISEEFEMVDNLFFGVSLLALFVGLGSLFAGIIGVGNIMWIIVKERTHEFGIRRAIGATPADITVQVLSESIVLTLVAGIAGVAFAVLVLGTADALTADPIHGTAGFEITLAMALSVVAAFFVLGSAAGTLPAVKAMKIKPIEAINDK